MNINLTYTTMNELPASAVVRPGAILKIRRAFMGRCSYDSYYLLTEQGNLVDISNTPSRGKEIKLSVMLTALQCDAPVWKFLQRQVSEAQLLEIATSEGVWSLEPLVSCAAEKQE